MAAGDKNWWGAVMVWGSPLFEFVRFDFLYSGAFWGGPLPKNEFRFVAYILTCLASILIYTAYTDLLHGHSTSHCYLTHGCYSDVEVNHDHCPIVSIFCESQGLFQMQLEIWDSCLILFTCYRPKD